MPVSRIRSALAAAAIAMCAAQVPVAAAAPAAQLLEGTYTVTTHASQKTGTSIAARQPEPDFGGDFQFVTDCSSGRCVATVLGGAPSANPTVPQPQRYTWNGSGWVFVYDWQWECYEGDDVPRLYAPARSQVSYVPVGDGSLQGTWQTEIASGACQGSVIMPVSARPAGH